MMKRSITVCIVTLALTFLVGRSEAASEVKTVYWASTQAGTVGYLLPASLTAIMWKYSNNTIKIVPEPLRGTTQVAQRLREKKADVGSAGANTAYEMYFSKGFFEGQENWGGLRTLWPYTVSYIQCPLLKKNPINSIYDLKGKRIRVPEKGSQGDSDARNLLKGAGYDIEKDLSLSWGTFPQAMDAIKDGHVDVFICNSGMPSSAILELDVVQDIKFLEIPEEVVKNMNRIFYEGKDIYQHAVVVPEGLYRGMRKGYRTVCNIYVNTTRADVDQELVYQMTKIFWEHKDELDASLPAMKNVDKTFIPRLPTQLMPFAEGALRYYKEVGWLK